MSRNKFCSNFAHKFNDDNNVCSKSFRALPQQAHTPRVNILVSIKIAAQHATHMKFSLQEDYAMLKLLLFPRIHKKQAAVTTPIVC